MCFEKFVFDEIVGGTQKGGKKEKKGEEEGKKKCWRYLFNFIKSRREKAKRGKKIFFF